jgi:hypothetical protein
MQPHIKVADECWIALALLTREHPERESFSSREILNQIRREGAHPELRAGVPAHIHQHNVVNYPPSTARYRMFYRLEDGAFRLYRPGDVSHPERSGKTYPRRAELPPKYHPLLDWYEKDYCKGSAPAEEEEDPILSLRGLGKQIWAGVDPDAYVNELRSGWIEGDKVPVSWDGGAANPPPSGRPQDAERIWERVLRHQGAEFKTITGRPFTHKIEGGSGIWFFRNGRRIEHRLWRGELEAALTKCPLTKTTDLARFQCPSYLFGLLTDPRIIGGEERG